MSHISTSHPSTAAARTFGRRTGFLLAGLLFLTICVSVIPAESLGSLEGRYEAERKGDRVQLQLRLGQRQIFGSQIPARAFRERPDGEVEMRREAGVFVFAGFDAAGATKQAGTFVFSPDKAYVQAMEKRGHRGLDSRELFKLATIDLTIAFVDSLAALGYKEDLDGLVEMRIHGVDASYIEDLGALGYKNLPARRLVEMRIHGVDAAYVRDMAASGYRDLSAKHLVEMRIHGVDGRFAGDMAALGYDDLPASRLVEMRIHGVDPSWVRSLADLGYRGLPASRLVEMRIHGVDPAWVRELQDLGYRGDDVTPSQLVEMRIHGVDPTWIRGLGEPRLSVRRLIEKRIHGG